MGSSGFQVPDRNQKSGSSGFRVPSQNPKSGLQWVPGRGRHRDGIGIPADFRSRDLNFDPGFQKSIPVPIPGPKIDPGTGIPLGSRSQCRPLILGIVLSLEFGGLIKINKPSRISPASRVLKIESRNSTKLMEPDWSKSTFLNNFSSAPVASFNSSAEISPS